MDSGWVDRGARRSMLSEVAESHHVLRSDRLQLRRRFCRLGSAFARSQLQRTTSVAGMAYAGLPEGNFRSTHDLQRGGEVKAATRRCSGEGGRLACGAVGTGAA